MKQTKIAITDQKGKKEVISQDTPTPIFKRAKKVDTLADAEKLLSNTLSLFQKGKISAADAKNLSYLCQVFAQIRKQSLEEKKIFELIEFHTVSLISDARFLIDDLMEAMITEFALSPEKVEEVANFFIKSNTKLSTKFLDKRKAIIEQINKSTSFNANLFESSNYEDVKNVLFFKIRQLDEKSRYELLDEMIEKFYARDDE